MRRMLLPTISAALTLTLTASVFAADASSPSPSASPETAPSAVLKLDPPGGRRYDGWHEVGRMPAYPGDGTEFYMDHLAAVGEGLVSLGRNCPIEGGRCDEYGLYSEDATTWMRTEFPGVETQIEDIASTPDGLIAVGLHLLDGERHAAMWRSADGIEWTPATAPPVATIHRIIATGERTVVGTAQGAWATQDGEEWDSLGRPPAGPPVAGSGGFLSAGGGGQDRFTPTVLWHSPDGKTWSKVRLPRALRRGHDAFGEIQVFSLGDRWVLLPREKAPRSMFISVDGTTWRKAPRPAGMSAGYTGWMERIGDRVQSSGTVTDLEQTLWTWNLGRKAPAGIVLREGTSIGRPVPWMGGYAAIGWDSSTDEQMLWRWGSPPEAGPATSEE